MTYKHFDLAFDLLPEVSASRLEGTSLRKADYATWKMATEWECTHARTCLTFEKVESVEDYEVVGEYYRDLSGWCDIEGKFEFCHDHILLLAPKKHMDRFKVDYTFEDIAAEHGFTEWA